MKIVPKNVVNGARRYRMEEATEKLVKLYLESKGFLVKTGIRVKIGKNNSPEIDILAIRPVQRTDNLPNKLLGEVKSYGLNPSFFKEINSHNRFSKDYSHRLKLFNDDNLRARFLQQIEKLYGTGFCFVLFVRDIPEKYFKELSEHLNNKGFVIVFHKEMVQEVIEYSKRENYSNDSELQLLRLMRKFKINTD